MPNALEIKERMQFTAKNCVASGWQKRADGWILRFCLRPAALTKSL